MPRLSLRATRYSPASSFARRGHNPATLLDDDEEALHEDDEAAGVEPYLEEDDFPAYEDLEDDDLGDAMAVLDVVRNTLDSGGQRDLGKSAGAGKLRLYHQSAGRQGMEEGVEVVTVVAEEKEAGKEKGSA